MFKSYRIALSGAFGFYFKKQRKGFLIAAIGLFLLTNFLCLPVGFAIHKIQKLLHEKDQFGQNTALIMRLWEAGERKIEKENRRKQVIEAPPVSQRPPLSNVLANEYIYLVAPEEIKQEVIPLFKEANAVLISQKAPNAWSVVYDNIQKDREGVRSNVWRLDGPESKDAQASELVSKLNRVLNEASQRKLDVWIATRPPNVYRHETISLQGFRNTLDRLMEASEVALPLVFFVSLLYIVAFAGSMQGFEWDMRRTRDVLEPWASALMPTWILYVADALSRSLYAMLIMTIVSSTFYLYGFNLPVFWWLAGLIFTFGITFVLGMWGMLTTMMFHHRYGRMFARILLSPATIMVLLMFRGSVLVSAQRMLGNSEAQSSGWMDSLLHGASFNIWMPLMVLAGGLIAFSIGAFLVPIIEWRIGALRQGLRKL